LNGTTSIRPLQQEVQLAPFHGSLARFDDACSKTETADMMRMGSAAKISSSTSPKRIATAAEASITMARLLARQSDPVAPRPSALGVSRSGCAADRLSDRQELVTSPRRGARAFLARISHSQRLAVHLGQAETEFRRAAGPGLPNRPFREADL
jgi:hypothetical protein